MELQDLFDLREVATAYRNTIPELGYSNPSVENFEALHVAIETVDLNEMPDLFMCIDTKWKNHINSFIGVFENLENDIKNNMPTIRCFDKGVAYVIVFCKTIIKELRRGIDMLNNRIATTPDADDTNSLDILNDYIDGIFGDMDFNEFVDNCLIYGLPDWRIERRINYLISATDNEQIKSALSLYLTERKESQELQPSPAVQATAKDNATSPDYPMTDRFMSALYLFLRDEGVIKGIYKGKEIEVDEATFNECVTRGNMNKLWDVCGKLRKRNQLRCVIRYLKDKFDTYWLDTAIKFGLPKNITSFNRETIGDFESKVRNLFL